MTAVKQAACSKAAVRRHQTTCRLGEYWTMVWRMWWRQTSGDSDWPQAPTCMHLRDTTALEVGKNPHYGGSVLFGFYTKSKGSNWFESVASTENLGSVQVRSLYSLYSVGFVLYGFGASDVWQFLSRVSMAMLTCDTHYRSSVRPSVRPLHSGIVLKRLNVSSYFL